MFLHRFASVVGIFLLRRDLDDAVVAAVGDERVAVRQAVGVTRPVEADLLSGIDAPRDLPTAVALVEFDHVSVLAIGDDALFTIVVRSWLALRTKTMYRPSLIGSTSLMWNQSFLVRFSN